MMSNFFNKDDIVIALKLYGEDKFLDYNVNDILDDVFIEMSTLYNDIAYYIGNSDDIKVTITPTEAEEVIENKSELLRVVRYLEQFAIDFKTAINKINGYIEQARKTLDKIPKQNQNPRSRLNNLRLFILNICDIIYNASQHKIIDFESIRHGSNRNNGDNYISNTPEIKLFTTLVQEIDKKIDDFITDIKCNKRYDNYYKDENTTLDNLVSSAIEHIKTQSKENSVSSMQSDYLSKSVSSCGGALYSAEKHML